MNSLTRIILFYCLILCSMQVSGQQAKVHVAGSWQGTLDVGTSEIRLVFNIFEQEDFSLRASMDSPDQGAMDIPLGDISLWDDSIRIEAPVLNGYYVGMLKSESSMEGQWHQNGVILELDLDRKEEAIVLNRPQEPQPPYPYNEEEVSFQNSKQGISLGGTLTLPKGDGPFPATILVSGSGAQNRDEEIFGHKPFKLIADYLTRNGIAVLRYDDRGVGESEGSASGATTADLSGDARAAIDYLLERKDIDHSKIGVIGHSEGGMIAFMLASSHKDIAFIVTLAGPGVDGKTILLDQSNRIASLSGASEATLEDNRNVMSGVYDIMISNESYADWKEKTLEFTSEFYSERLKGSYSDADIERGKENLLASIPESAYAWMRYFVMFDPSPLFGTITCPVLALNGKKDCQVLPEPNIHAIREGLEGGGNMEVESLILPGLNHLFQNCETGLFNEYGALEETFDEKALRVISDWVLSQTD